MFWKIPRAAIPAAFLLLLASIAVPNVLHVRNRSRQKVTMAAMRSVAMAWEARASDVNTYAVRGTRGPATAAELARVLEPTYIRKMPLTDSWGTELQLATGDVDADGHANTYTIRSLGSDRRPDRAPNLSGPTTDFTDDIVLSNGSFVRYPEEAG